MAIRTRTAAAFVIVLLPVYPVGGALVRAAKPLTIQSFNRTDSTRLTYEIAQDRADHLPKWDPRTAPDPPLSFAGALKAARAWQFPKFGTQKVAEAGLYRNNPWNTWYYHIIFRANTVTPTVNVIVLLDGSVVEARVDKIKP